MKKLLLLCSLFVGTSALVSCSSDDDSSGDGGGDPVATSITLTADVTSIELGSSVTLSVMNDLDEDVTGTSTYFASGATLSSNVFTPTAGGEYTIHATNGELVSNTITVTVTAVQQSNAIFYNETNSPINVTSISLWNLVDGTDDGVDEPTHVYGSIVGTSDTIDDIENIISTLYNSETGNPDYDITTLTDSWIEIDFYAEIIWEAETETWTVVSPNSVVFGGIYNLVSNGVRLVNQGEGEQTVTTFDVTTDFATLFDDATASTLEFSLDSELNGSQLLFDYNGAFSWGSGGRYSAEASNVFSIMPNNKKVR